MCELQSQENQKRMNRLEIIVVKIAHKVVFYKMYKEFKTELKEI